MGALHLPNIGGELDALLGDNSGGTDLTMSSPALVALPEIAAPDYIWVCWDPDGIAGAPEWGKITAHALSSSTATVTREEQGSTAREHKSGVEWVHTLAPSEADLLVPHTPVRVNRTTLTTKTSVTATSAYEQWGTEEAIVAQADVDAEVTVMAWVTGTARNVGGAANAAADVRVEISLDGGATWQPGQPTYCQFPAGANIGIPVAALHSVAGAVTGDVMARAQVAIHVGTTDPDFIQGVLMMQVVSA